MSLAAQPARPDVLILLHDLRGGGAERAMLRLAGGMAAAGRRVHLLLVSAQGDYLSEIPPAVTMSDLGGGSVFGAIPAIAKALKTYQPRAFLAALTHVNVAAIIAAALAGYRGRLVVSERNQISAKAAAAKSLREKITYAVAPWAYARTDGIVAVSDGVAKDLITFARLPAEIVHYVHNPVYDAGLAVRGEAPAPHPWLEDGGAPVIIAVGRLHEQKDFATLLAGFFELRATRPARLIIFGEGPERQALERLISGSAFAADVALPGFCTNPFAAMSRAAMLVLSSRWEGFPNVLVEAMSCGAAVAATDCPSGPQEILDGGRYGPLVKVGDASGLAMAMSAVLDNPDAGPIAAERAKVFSVERAAASYLEILRA
ncbi:glycosyltransferase [Caulobacter endophyticus]|uniref:glycosyltransferase n=1 Tax=Caulobacter endophyticus TaxID=2172652 RepID=UPI0011B1D320|nr:glycosyltransferase [Caulobacter endophyticus]